MREEEYGQITVTPLVDGHGRPLGYGFELDGPKVAVDAEYIIGAYGWTRYIKYESGTMTVGPYRFKVEDHTEKTGRYELTLIGEDRLFPLKERLRMIGRRFILILEALGLAYAPPGEIPSLGHIFAIAKRRKTGDYRGWDSDYLAVAELYLMYINGEITEAEYFDRLEQMQAGFEALGA